PPPAPFTGRAPLPTLVDSAELVAQRLHLESPPSTERAPAPESDDSPDASPELEVGEYTPSSRSGRARPRMVALTLLDGTTLNPPEGRSSAPPREGRISPVPPSKPHGASVIEPLTARDLVSALRAVAHGADASEVLGNTDWQAMFAALLSLLLKKNLIADWEYVEELRNI